MRLKTKFKFKERKRLFTDTVPVNKMHLTDTVSVNKMHLTDTVSAKLMHLISKLSVYKMHLTGTGHLDEKNIIDTIYHRNLLHPDI